VGSRHLSLFQLAAELLHLDALDFVRGVKLLALLLNVRIRLLPLLNLAFRIFEFLTHLLVLFGKFRLSGLQAPLAFIVKRVAMGGHRFVGVGIHGAERGAMLLRWSSSRVELKRCRAGRHVDKTLFTACARFIFVSIAAE
jgi:hypothetical protein